MRRQRSLGQVCGSINALDLSVVDNCISYKSYMAKMTTPSMTSRKIMHLDSTYAVFLIMNGYISFRSGASNFTISTRGILLGELGALVLGIGTMICGHL